MRNPKNIHRYFFVVIMALFDFGFLLYHSEGRLQREIWRILGERKEEKVFKGGKKSSKVKRERV